MRHQLSAALLLSFVGAASCTVLSPLDDLTSGSTPPTNVGGGGGEGGSPPESGGECATPAECAPPTSSCIDVTCEGGFCVYAAKADLSPVQSQVAGDCKSIVCSGGGEEPIAAAMDIYDDANACTVDACGVGNVPTNNPAAINTVCSEGFCNGDGACVECNDTMQCSDANEVCDENKCVPLTCTDGMYYPPETDTDCGGPDCNPCPADSDCLVDTDCQSEVCEGDICQPPTCEDVTLNGNETDTDCGGDDCLPCDDGSDCSAPTDCTSGVCSGGICQAPACGDGVQNGSESDVDCGGMNACPRCKPGYDCNSASDCLDGLTCNGQCVDSCSDGVKNFQETDVDCGGSLCDPCPKAKNCLCDSDCVTNICCGKSGIPGLTCQTTTDSCDIRPLCGKVGDVTSMPAQP